MGIKDNLSKAKTQNLPDPASGKRPPAKRRRAAGAKGRKKAASKTGGQTFVEGLVESAGEGVTRMDQDVVLASVENFIETGFHEVDYILGGGFAVGRCSEVFGPEGAGKTALAQATIRNHQRTCGGASVYIDFENAVDPDQLDDLGIDRRLCAYTRPACIEDAWDYIWKMMAHIKKNPPDQPVLFVWDSVAQSVPKAELEAKSSSDKQVAEIARAMSKGCRRMLNYITDCRAHMMWINQERSNIGGGPFSEAITVGGNAIRYASSQRCRVTRRETLKDKRRGIEAKTGYRVHVLTKKNRCFPPHQKGQYILDFTEGPSRELTMFAVLLDAKLIKSAGGGTYRVAWRDEKFPKKRWSRLLQDPEFAAGAEEAMDEACRYLHPIADKVSEDEDDDEGETED